MYSVNESVSFINMTNLDHPFVSCVRTVYFLKNV